MTKRSRAVNKASPISFGIISVYNQAFSRIVGTMENRPVMRKLGRILQIASLALLPLSFPLQITGWLGSSVSPMLLMMVAAFCLFYIGRLVEGYASGS